MRRFLILAVLLASLAATGCQRQIVDGRPPMEYVQADATFRATMESLIVVREQGKISDAKWAEISEWAVLADALLDRWHLAIVVKATLPPDATATDTLRAQDAILSASRAAMAYVGHVQREATRLETEP